jgi:ferrous iron transport protein B
VVPPNDTALDTLQQPSLGARAAGSSSVIPLVALVGPPNSGKSTLFNQLTGLRQKVANYPGVTVEKKMGRARLAAGGDLDIVDLPGVNGFSARTLDEKVTRDVLEGRAPGLRVPDAIVLITDVTRFEQQLMLCEPVLELGIPTLLILNMCDELEARGGDIDEDLLVRELGVDVVRAAVRTGRGLDAVHDFLEGVVRRGPLPERPCPAVSNVPRGVVLPTVDVFRRRREHVREIGRRAGFVAAGPSRLTERLDSVLLHKVWGPVVFFAVVVLVFQAIFSWATPDRHERALGGELPAGLLDPLAHHQRRLRGCRLRRHLPAPDPHPLPLPGDPGGLGLPGPRRVHRGPADVPGRAPGPGLSSPAVRLRLRSAGDPVGSDGRG